MKIYTKIWLLFFSSFVISFVTVIATFETGLASFQLLNVIPYIFMQHIWCRALPSAVGSGKVKFNMVILVTVVLIITSFI